MVWLCVELGDPKMWEDSRLKVKTRRGLKETWLGDWSAGRPKPIGHISYYQMVFDMLKRSICTLNSNNMNYKWKEWQESATQTSCNTILDPNNTSKPCFWELKEEKSNPDKSTAQSRKRHDLKQHYRLFNSNHLCSSPRCFNQQLLIRPDGS